MRMKKSGIAAFLCLLMLASAFFVPLSVCASQHAPASEEAQETVKLRKVRVGFPIQKGLTEKDENGNYTGYTVEYLDQLMRYVNWEIEYVEAEGDVNQQLITLLDMLDKGEIDLLGAMNYSEALEEQYLYPSYSYGTAYTTLCVKEDNSRWMEDDFRNWDGITVAVYPNMARREGYLSKFAEVSGFSYETIECDSYEECVDKVLNGEADATIQIDISTWEGLRSIARFSPSPYYLAANKERTELIRELNVGMNSLAQSYPNLQSELYDEYFRTNVNFFMSEEDKEMVQTLDPLRVLIFNGNMPVQSCDNGEAHGVAAGILEEFSKETGIQYKYVFADSFEEGKELIKNGEVDVVAAVPAQAKLTFDENLHLSLPYFKSNAILVGTEGADPENVSIQNLSANVRDLLKKMNRDPGRASILDAYCVNYYMHDSGLYKNLTIDWTGMDEILYCFGFAEGTDERLVGIANHFIKSLSDEAIQQMLYKSSTYEQKYTLMEYLSMYKWSIIIISCGLILLISLYFFYRKSRELQNDKVESERLYEFSKMTDECLLEYDEKKDKLILRNNHVLFPNHHIVYQFRKKLPNYKYHSENEKICVQIILDMLDTHETKRDFALNINGIEYWYKMVLVHMDSGFTIGRITDANQDIRERQELERKARTDQLTGLLNRTALETTIIDHIRNGYREGIYLLMDLDNFKNVNDIHGHREGDRLLCRFANELTASFRGTDLKARLGGDEFVVFIPNGMEEGRLAAKLTEFIHHVADEVFADYVDCHLSVSIGACAISERTVSAEDLYKEADGAMYIAKYGGKNDFFISDGEVCLKRVCTNCRQDCRQKAYLTTRNKLTVKQ